MKLEILFRKFLSFQINVKLYHSAVQYNLTNQFGPVKKSDSYNNKNDFHIKIMQCIRLYFALFEIFLWSVQKFVLKNEWMRDLIGLPQVLISHFPNHIYSKGKVIFNHVLYLQSKEELSFVFQSKNENKKKW